MVSFIYFQRPNVVYKCQQIKDLFHIVSKTLRFLKSLTILLDDIHRLFLQLSFIFFFNLICYQLLPILNQSLAAKRKYAQFLFTAFQMVTTSGFVLNIFKFARAPNFLQVDLLCRAVSCPFLYGLFYFTSLLFRLYSFPDPNWIRKYESTQINNSIVHEYT